MAMTWFKLHHEIIEDPKIAMMGETDQLIWFKLLCLASADRERGNVSLNDEEIAFKLRCSKETWLHAKDKFRAKGMIEPIETRLQISNWEKRQYAYPSDKPEATKARKDKQRAKSKKTIEDKKTEDVTIVTSESRDIHELITSLSQHCHDTDPDTDLDLDLEKEKELIKEISLPEENSFSEPEPEPVPKPIKPTKQPAAERYEQFRLVYNANKPKNFAGADAVNPARQKKIAAEFKTHGDRTIEVLEKALKYANHEKSWFQTKPVIAFKLDSFLTMGITGFAEQWDHFEGPGAEEAATDTDRLALYEELYAQGDAEALLRPIDPNKEPEEYGRRFEFYRRKGEEAVRAARLRA